MLQTTRTDLTASIC